ncbi:hypothetical protein D9M68_129240 [compost metagenome]
MTFFANLSRIAIARQLPSLQRTGAIVVAVVAGSPERLRNRLLAGFADHPKAMRPRLVLSVSALPRNAQGKLMRPHLVDAVLSRYAFVDGSYPQALLNG